MSYLAGGGSGGGAARAEGQYVAAMTSVWWDIESCAIPSNCDPHLIALNISSALENLGYRGRVSISAYGDTHQIPDAVQRALNNTGVSLHHIPAGVKDASDKIFLVDMLFWAMDNPPPSNYLLISGDRDFSNAVHLLGLRKYNVLLAQPQYVSSALVAAARSVWEWPSLVVGGPPMLRLPEACRSYISDSVKASQPSVFPGNQNAKGNDDDNDNGNGRPANNGNGNGRAANGGSVKADNDRCKAKQPKNPNQPIRISRVPSNVLRPPVPGNQENLTSGISDNIFPTKKPGILQQNHPLFQGESSSHPQSAAFKLSWFDICDTGHHARRAPPSTRYPPANIPTINNLDTAIESNKPASKKRKIESNEQLNGLSGTPIGAALPPDDSSGTPMDAALPPDGSSGTPMDAALPPDGSLGAALPPDGSSATPMGAALPPDGSSGTPMGAAFPPDRSSATPMGAALPPDGSLTTPVGAALPPAGSPATPVGATLTPAGSSGTPMGAVLPPDGHSGTPMGAALPPNGSSATPMGAALPPDGFSGTPMGAGFPPNILDILGDILSTLKDEKMPPTEANIEDCVRYGEMNIQYFDVRGALDYALMSQHLVEHKSRKRNRPPYYIKKEEPLLKCVQDCIDKCVQDCIVKKHPKKTWDSIQKFLSSSEGHRAMQFSQCRFQAAVRLKKACLKTVALGDILQLLKVIIDYKKWILPHATGWQPLSVTCPNPKSSDVSTSLNRTSLTLDMDAS